MISLKAVPKQVQAVAIAQLLSVLLTIMGVTSAKLSEAGINAPTTQSFFNYLLLTVVCGSIHAWNVRTSRRKQLQGGAMQDGKFV